MTPKYFETKRGCGFREVGKLYLVGEGVAYICPSLPLIFKPCDCCGYEPPQYRDFQWLKKSYVRHIREPTGQMCHPKCPVCYPGTNDQSQYGLMWVGRKFYTPESFLEEIDSHGDISKAIKQIPKGLKLGETWVLLAHPEAYVDASDDEYAQLHSDWIRAQALKKMDEKKDPEPQPPTYPGIFTAFIPQRVEMLVYQSEATPEYVLELEEKGITVIVVPDEYDGHKRKTRRARGRSNIA